MLVTGANDASQPMTLDALHLPPTFVTDHCVRTLFYQGALSPVEIARHWRVHVDIAVEAVESLKAAGLVETESGASSIERAGRFRLNSAGQAHAAAARGRTWYAGPLPVALSDYERRLSSSQFRFTTQTDVTGALEPFIFDPALEAEIGQAVAAGATLALAGLAYDEQSDVARAIGSALRGDVYVPFAVYASGAVLRLLDRRVHIVNEDRPAQEGDEINVLRTRAEATQWVTTPRPVVMLAGGVMPSDVIPAFGEDAKFYLPPAPLLAGGGMLAVLDAESDLQALAELARLWLVPGRDGTGIMLLRSGERIELPWRACTVLCGATPASFPATLRDGVVYTVDVSELAHQAVAPFLARRLSHPAFADDSVAYVAGQLARLQTVTRNVAACTARYLRERAAYEGDAFAVTPDVAHRAIDFACAAAERPQGDRGSVQLRSAA